MQKKGEKTAKILIALGAGAILTLELIDMIFGSYQRSYKVAHKRLYSGSGSKINHKYTPDELQRFYALLHKLKKQGLVDKHKAQNGNLWKITASGLSKLRMFKSRKINYAQAEDNSFKIIVFDIPEKERNKRNWLREILKLLGFKMLQKSVWIGKKKIPEQFLTDLRKKQLLSYIHILEVSKSGTIKELN